VTRTLRAFALVGVLGLGVYLLGFALYHAAALPVVGTGRGAVLGTYILAAAVMYVAARIGITVVSVAGVIAAVAGVQRLQRGWAVALIGGLVLYYVLPLLLAFVPSVVQRLLPSTLIPAADGPLLGVELAAPIALLVLVYSFLPATPRASASTASEAAGG
jgi:hypothetical protein